MSIAPRAHHRASAVRTPIACAIWLAIALASGCGDDGTGPTGPEVAGGGQERLLDFETFRTAIAPVLHARGCSADGDCHGGGIRGAFELSPAETPDDDFDFAQAVEQINDLDPASSPLLLKPLAADAGGAPHSFTAFTSTSDADFQAILAWIEAGELRP